jgi:hypothetical protein
VLGLLFSLGIGCRTLRLALSLAKGFQGADFSFSVVSFLRRGMDHGARRWLLHLLGRLDPQQSQRMHQLFLHQLRQPQKKRPFLLIRFRENVMLVVEIVERLR